MKKLLFALSIILFSCGDEEKIITEDKSEPTFCWTCNKTISTPTSHSSYLFEICDITEDGIFKVESDNSSVRSTIITITKCHKSGEK